MYAKRWVVVGSMAAVLTCLHSAQAYAQEDYRVSPTGKGITGGALLGAEVVMLSEALIGVKPAWAYIVGGVAGAAGGGVGGYYAEQQSSAKLSLYLLAGGMALAIPTTIAVLSRTAYEPPVEFTQDTPPADEPVAEPPQPSDTVDEAPVEPVPGPAEETRNSFRPTRTRRMARASRPVPLWRPPALLGLAPRGLVLSVPMVEVREVFSRRELYEYGVKQETELHVPVVSASF